MPSQPPPGETERVIIFYFNNNNAISRAHNSTVVVVPRCAVCVCLSVSHRRRRHVSREALGKTATYADKVRRSVCGNRVFTRAAPIGMLFWGPVCVFPIEIVMGYAHYGRYILSIELFLHSPTTGLCYQVHCEKFKIYIHTYFLDYFLFIHLLASLGNPSLGFNSIVYTLYPSDYASVHQKIQVNSHLTTRVRM